MIVFLLTSQHHNSVLWIKYFWLLGLQGHVIKTNTAEDEGNHLYTIMCGWDREKACGKVNITNLQWCNWQWYNSWYCMYNVTCRYVCNNDTGE